MSIISIFTINTKKLCLYFTRIYNVFSIIFYFIYQIRSFYMISIFIINTKINFFYFTFFVNFIFFENEIKVCLKIYKKIIFEI